jgi:DNA transposition AAA+ family ATPase
MSTKLSETEKKEIQFKLRIYVANFRSQKKAAHSLADCSEATLICMLSDQDTCWDKISDAMWLNVSNQVSSLVDFNKLVETENFKIVTAYLDTARQEGCTFALTGAGGYGKTYTAKWYHAMNRTKNVIYLECPENITKSIFLRKLLGQLGINGMGMGNYELMEVLVKEIRRISKKDERPLIILDEVDKLPDPVLKYFITFYNEMNKLCGFVWLSTDTIEKRLERGRNGGKIGYQELFSRIGGRFIHLKQPTHDEITDICIANGITSKERIAYICNDVGQLKGDLRRVDRSILQDKVKRNKLKRAA